MNDEEIRKVVRQTLKEISETLGYNLASIEGQRELREDLKWAREARKSGENIANYAKRAAVSALIGGTLYLVWLGFKNKLGG